MHPSRRFCSFIFQLRLVTIQGMQPSVGTISLGDGASRRNNDLPFARILIRTIIWACCVAASFPLAAASLTNGTVHPKNGNLSTVFKFSVTYRDTVLTNLPTAVHLILDESVTNVMSSAVPADLDPTDGKTYVWSGTLPMARHRFRFATAPASTGDLGRHVGPDVSDAPLLVRPFYFFLDCPADYLAEDFYLSRHCRFTWAGDLNGDGYADLAHTWYEAPIQGHTNEGAAIVYYGPDFARHDCLLHPRYPARQRFGYSVGGGADINGDGYGDLVVGTGEGSQSRLFVYYGRAAGAPVLAREIAGSGLEKASAITDVDQDGYGDLATIEIEGSGDIWSKTRLRVRYGPDLSRTSSSVFGVGGNEYLIGTLSVADRNGDGFPDFLIAGDLNITGTSGGSGATSHAQIRSADGPGLSTSVLYTEKMEPMQYYFRRGTVGIGDVTGDGKDDFACAAGILKVDWYTGPSLTGAGTVPFPGGTNFYCGGFFGAGDGTGSGRSSMVMFKSTSYNTKIDECGLYYCWGSAASPFSSQAFLSAPMAMDLPSDNSFWGLAHDTDGNGLDDFYIAPVGSSEAPLGGLASMTLGTVLVGSPCYPYPLSEGDLPARFRARMAGCTIDLGQLGSYPLAPNGSLEFVAGTADSDHRAPLIILADSFLVPDKPFGHVGSEPLVIRVGATGEDGSGYIYADGPNKGKGQLQMKLRVQIVQLGQTGESIWAADTMLAKVDLDPPLDLATGYGKLVCRGVMQGLLSKLSIPSTDASLAMVGYVEYVRPAETPFLMRVPARADFGGVCVGGNAPAQRIALCNLGETSLRLTGLTLPGAPFRITGAPTLPATVNPASALVLTAEYVPTSPGHHEATITVTSDDPSHPVTTILLSGTAIGAGEQDSDGDGMPDSFENRYSRPTNAKFSGLSTNRLDAHLDNDGDGSANLNEYLAGTDPTNEKSVFKLVSAQRLSANALQLSWLSVTGRTYSVCRSTNLASSYIPIQTGLLGNGTTNTFTDSAATGSPAHFYRVGVE